MFGVVVTRPWIFEVKPGTSGTFATWIGVYLDVSVDWDEVATLVANAYRAIAPKRLLAELDATKRTTS